MFGLIGSIIGGGIGYAAQQEAQEKQEAENERNRQWSSMEAMKARSENFNYGEMAANAADARQRAQFNDMYSPKAQVEQLIAAGLSPSLMFGGAPSGGSATGQQGGGASGAGAPQAGYSSSVAAGAAAAQSIIGGAQAGSQIELNKALANKANAEAEVQEGKKTALDLENKFKEMQNTIFENQNALFNAVSWTNADGTPTSLFEIAHGSDNFKIFKDKVINAAERGGVSKEWYTNEETIKQLRNYYEDIQKFETNLTTLTNIKADNEFYTSLLNTMNTKEFIDLTVNEQLQKLRTSVETQNLTEQQKSAWNRLLNKLEDGTTKDLLIVAFSIVDRALSEYKAPTIINHRTTNNYQE